MFRSFSGVGNATSLATRTAPVGGRVSLVESPLKVRDMSHETNLLAKGKPEAGPEDPANQPVVAAILRNPNRMRNAESPRPDIAACSPGPAHVSFHTAVTGPFLIFAECFGIGAESLHGV